MSTVVNVVVALVIVGGLFTGLNLLINRVSQKWDDRLRPWLFISPAVVFLTIALVVPAIRTVFLSFRGGNRGDDGFTTENWTDLLGNKGVISVDRMGDVLTSRLFILGVILLVVGVVVARRSAGDGNGLDLGNPISSVALGTAVLAALMAVFSTLRGVIWNNLWWVVVVAGLSTVFGLALAVLADRSKRESVAKTLIFMPMAISLVGAAVIWKFIYDTPGAGQSQGLLNLLWPGEPIDYLRGTSGSGTIAPWNNFFIMVIMIWIQAGFAMVVISAAIKGVPSELGEAARVDGASEPQVFWRVTLPQITSTLLVVITTLTITVLKVFDLVKATTGGAADTDVLANRVYDTLRSGNFTASSTYAVMIFVLVLPVMYLNIRRNRGEVR
ncbi:MAG: carbohydrate ABC transporter permease [Microthrixaceae bacterium]